MYFASIRLFLTLCPTAHPQGNPCCEEPDYRLALIYRVPSVQVLDLHKVTDAERRKAAGVWALCVCVAVCVLEVACVFVGGVGKIGGRDRDAEGEKVSSVC